MGFFKGLFGGGSKAAGREACREKLLTDFRKKVNSDSAIRNAYLLVHSEKLNLHLNQAEGYTGDFKAVPQQPNYMASIGKLFTATVVSLLHEQGKLSFEDTINQYLDPDLVDGLHIHKGTDYSHEIQIRHLLNQTSGLPDNFWPLLEKLLEEPDFSLSPREAVDWTKIHATPTSPPGEKASYTDTNYHLLGLIVENVRGEPFHEVLKKMIFAPLDMKQSCMLHTSHPITEFEYPVADFFIEDRRLNDLAGFAGIDFAGGGVTATLEDLLKFMKALVARQIVSAETLNTMLSDKASLGFNFDYGYGIWLVKSIPILLPEKFRSWGVLGATGAFMFYHPKLEAYVIGNFNHTSQQRSCVRYIMKVFNTLWKHSGQV